MRTADGRTVFAFRQGSATKSKGTANGVVQLRGGGGGYGLASNVAVGAGEGDAPLVPGFLPPRTGPLGV